MYSTKHGLDIPLIKPPKTTRIPDILSPDQLNRLFAATNRLSYRVFFFTIYSLGLRLGEGINLTAGDIDSHTICGFISVTPRATKTAWFRCRNIPSGS